MKTLKKQALEYLIENKGRISDLALETGINIEWFRKFMGRHSMPDPGVSKIERVIRHRDGTLHLYYPELKKSA